MKKTKIKLRIKGRNMPGDLVFTRDITFEMFVQILAYIEPSKSAKELE